MLDELDQLEQQVAQLPKGQDKTRMTAMILSIPVDLRKIDNLER